MTATIAWREQGPQLLENALPISTCEQILEYFAAREPRPRSYQGVVDERLRHCDYVPITDPVLAAQVHSLKEPVSELYGVPLALVDGQSPLIYRYGAGIGFVTHHDEVTDVEVARAADNGQPVVHGDITVTVSLSAPETYADGEFYFVDPPLEFKLPMGGLLTFPATRRVLHGVRPITSGHRFSMLMRFLAQVPDGRR